MTLNKLTIVGGGTAGLITALILNARFPYFNIRIIKSDKIGIIGVGEGSTEHWSDFTEYCGIINKDVVLNTDGTIKMGVMFEGWTPKKYFHSIISQFHEHRFGEYLAGFGARVSDWDQILTSDRVHEENLVFKNDKQLEYPKQFHFNTFKLNEYLSKICKERNIEIIDDEIKEVIVQDNNIKNIIGEKTNYTSDFYIDCTGFKKLLISKLGAEWQSFSQYLKLNEAIAFQTEDTDNYNTYTLAKCMDYGWMWRIPVYGRWGNGYVFNNNYINKDQAKQEVEKKLGREIEIARNIQFDPGKLDKSWIGNCCAIGLSSNFVEPLEATSIGTAIAQAFLLKDYIFNYKQEDVNDYNHKLDLIMENVRDFIALHYMIDKEDTSFWKDNKNNPMPDTLIYNLKKWKDKLPKTEDFKSTEYLLFKEQNFTSVLHGLGFYKDNDNIDKEFNSFPKDLRDRIKEILNQYDIGFDATPKVPHKKFLKSLYENK